MSLFDIFNKKNIGETLGSLMDTAKEQASGLTKATPGGVGGLVGAGALGALSVCGTGTFRIMFSGFSRQSGYPCYWIVPKDAPYSQVRLSPRICLRKSTPTLFNGLFRQSAMVSLLLPHVTPEGSNGILTVSAIGLAVRLSLRSRLTLIRLALIRKP